MLCVVVDAPSVRPVCIRPNKRAQPLAEGDEEVQLYVGQGDAYDMDGTMQVGGPPCFAVAVLCRMQSNTMQCLDWTMQAGYEHR